MKETEEQSIYKEVEGFVKDFNNGDPKAAASYYAEESTRVGAFGDISHGRKDIEKAYERMLKQTMIGAKAWQDKGSVRMLSPDLAVWEGSIEMTLAGEKPMKGYVVQVMKKTGGRWLVLEAHPKFYPPMPGK